MGWVMVFGVVMVIIVMIMIYVVVIGSNFMCIIGIVISDGVWCGLMNMFVKEINVIIYFLKVVVFVVVDLWFICRKKMEIRKSNREIL